MKRVMNSIGLGGVLVLSVCSIAHSFQLLSGLPMFSPTMAQCDRNPIQTNLRVWLDPIHQTSVGQAALPPGVEVPVFQSPGPETHALHMDLRVINNSQQDQLVEVLGWSWSQGKQTGGGRWSVQPEMTPFNQYEQVQRQLVELSDNKRVQVMLELKINEQLCQLRTQARPE